MKLPYALRILLICLSVGCSCNTVQAQSKLVAATKDGEEYYLMDRNIRKGRSVFGQCDYIEVWLKRKIDSTILAGYRVDLIKQRQRDNLPTLGFEHFSHSVTKIQIDCEQLKMRTMSLTHYDTKGEVLESSAPRDDLAEWIDVVPESVGDEMINNICEHAKANRQTK